MDDPRKANEADLMMAGWRQKFADYITRWRFMHGLTRNGTQEIALLACGRRRVSSGGLGKMEEAAKSVEAARAWHPETSLLWGLGEMNALIVEYKRTGVLPPNAKIRPGLLDQVEPMTDANGRPLVFRDFVEMFNGLQESPEMRGAHLECLTRYRALGMTLIRALESTGRGPLDLEPLLMSIPGNTEKLREAVYGRSNPSVTQLLDWLPDLMFALSQMTERTFTERELVSLCEGLETVSA